MSLTTVDELVLDNYREKVSQQDCTAAAAALGLDLEDWIEGIFETRVLISKSKLRLKIIKKRGKSTNLRQQKKNKLDSKGEKIFERALAVKEVGNLQELDIKWSEGLIPKYSVEGQKLFKKLHILENRRESGDYSCDEEYTALIERSVKPFFKKRIAMYKQGLTQSGNEKAQNEKAQNQILALLRDLTDKYAAAYDNMFKTQIEDGEGEVLAKWQRTTRNIDANIKKKKNSKGLQQQSPAIEDNLLHAYNLGTRYRNFCSAIARESNGTFRAAPSKTTFRCLEKMAFVHRSSKRKQWDASGLCDLLRGAIEYDSLARMLEGINLIYKHPDFVMVRLKDRMSPGGETAAKWRDAMINGYFKNDPDQFLFEIQLHHCQLLYVRQNMGGHFVYARLRSLLEALEVTYGEAKTKRISDTERAKYENKKKQLEADKAVQKQENLRKEGKELAWQTLDAAEQARNNLREAEQQTRSTKEHLDQLEIEMQEANKILDNRKYAVKKLEVDQLQKQSCLKLQKLDNKLNAITDRISVEIKTIKEVEESLKKNKKEHKNILRAINRNPSLKTMDIGDLEILDSLDEVDNPSLQERIKNADGSEPKGPNALQKAIKNVEQSYTLELEKSQQKLGQNEEKRNLFQKQLEQAKKKQTSLEEQMKNAKKKKKVFAGKHEKWTKSLEKAKKNDSLKKLHESLQNAAIDLSIEGFSHENENETLSKDIRKLNDVECKLNEANKKYKMATEHEKTARKIYESKEKIHLEQVQELPAEWREGNMISNGLKEKKILAKLGNAKSLSDVKSVEIPDELKSSDNIYKEYSKALARVKAVQQSFILQINVAKTQEKLQSLSTDFQQSVGEDNEVQEIIKLKKQELDILSKLSNARTLSEVAQVTIPEALQERCKFVKSRAMDRVKAGLEQLKQKIKFTESAEALRGLGINFWQPEGSQAISFSECTDPEIREATMVRLKILPYLSEMKAANTREDLYDIKEKYEKAFGKNDESGRAEIAREVAEQMKRVDNSCVSPVALAIFLIGFAFQAVWLAAALILYKPLSGRYTHRMNITSIIFGCISLVTMAAFTIPYFGCNSCSTLGVNAIALVFFNSVLLSVVGIPLVKCCCAQKEEKDELFCICLAGIFFGGLPWVGALCIQEKRLQLFQGILVFLASAIIIMYTILLPIFHVTYADVWLAVNLLAFVVSVPMIMCMKLDSNSSLHDLTRKVDPETWENV